MDTDLSAQVFTRCKLENNTELSLSGPCPTLDLDYNIYIEEALHGHLVAQLAFLPAAGLAGFALTVVQRPKMIGEIPDFPFLLPFDIFSSLNSRYIAVPLVHGFPRFDAREHKQLRGSRFRGRIHRSFCSRLDLVNFGNDRELPNAFTVSLRI